MASNVPRVQQDEVLHVAGWSRVHPAHRAAMAAMELPGDKLRAMHVAMRRGDASPYPLQEDDIHIPPAAIKGRVPVPVQGIVQSRDFFTACVYVNEGKLRVDHAGVPEFWLEINMDKLVASYMAWKFHPDNVLAQQVIASLEDEQQQQQQQQQQAAVTDSNC